MTAGAGRGIGPELENIGRGIPLAWRSWPCWQLRLLRPRRSNRPAGPIPSRPSSARRFGRSISALRTRIGRRYPPTSCRQSWSRITPPQRPWSSRAGSRPARGARLRPHPRPVPRRSAPPDAHALVEEGVITLDGDWAEVSVPRCASTLVGADEFRFVRFEGRWWIVYIALASAGAPPTARTPPSGAPAADRPRARCPS